MLKSPFGRTTMSPESLWRLRLKYEDSLVRCDLCGQRGIVGTDIKLILPEQEEAIPKRPEGNDFFFRCANPIPCRKRRFESNEDP
jgi:hypothetical protein